MTFPLPRDVIGSAYAGACRLEVRTLKPGNVHIYADGHGMAVSDFDRSADVSAPFVTEPQLATGARIRHAVDATFNAVACNTNLGILLLCVPLAVAAALPVRDASSCPPDEQLWQRLSQVLSELTNSDAREVFQAIARANPAGLGAQHSGDVRSGPPDGWTLMDAMIAARDRDLIANEYASGFASLKSCTAHYRRFLASGEAPAPALMRVFLDQLAARPDTHIARKHGAEAARWVMQRASQVLGDLEVKHGADLFCEGATAELLSFDRELKSKSYNPGSLADLMAGTAMAANLIARAGAPGR